jgi:glycosyltransferase involved in cell wall biosynthesis
MTPPLPTPADRRPTVAIVGNVQTPYRLQVHRRFAREIPEIRLASLFTHDVPDSPWRLQADPEINPVMFGPGEVGDDRGKAVRALHEWRKGGRICRWLAEHDVRMVVSGGYADPAQLRVLRWCRRQGVPCYIWADSNIRGDTATGLKRAVKNVVVRRVVRGASGCLVFGSMGREYFQRYGADPNRIFFVPFEPQYDLFANPDPSLVTDVRNRHGLGEGRRRIVFSGRLIPLKRVDLAIDAFAAIASKRPEWDLVICGGGPLDAALKARVPHALHDRIRFLGFIADQAELGAIYRCCDVMVLTSNREAWSLVINEGAAAGLVLVVSDVVGAAPELVHEGVNGRTFRSEDLPALIDALLDATDPIPLQERQAASRAVIARWRAQADPVEGFRAALRLSGVLPASSAAGQPSPQPAASPADNPGAGAQATDRTGPGPGPYV